MISHISHMSESIYFLSLAITEHLEVQIEMILSPTLINLSNPNFSKNNFIECGVKFHFILFSKEFMPSLSIRKKSINLNKVTGKNLKI